MSNVNANQELFPDIVPEKKEKVRNKGGRPVGTKIKPAVERAPAVTVPAPYEMSTMKAAEVLVSYDAEIEGMPRNLTDAHAYLLSEHEAGRMRTLELSPCKQFCRRNFEDLEQTRGLRLTKPKNATSREFKEYLGDR